MCEIRKDGVMMTDGILIPYDTDISDISPKHIEELTKNTSTLWGHFLIHREIKELKEIILPKLELIRTHTSGCPVNEAGVISLIDSRLKLAGKKRWEKVLETIKNVSLIVGALILILTLLERFQ